MKKFYLFCGFFLGLLLSLTPKADAQIWTEDFDGSNASNPFVFPCIIDDSRDYFGIVCLNGAGCADDINADYTPGYTGVTGSFFGARDINGDPCMNDAPVTSTASGIDISSCAGNLFICFDIAESDTPAREGTDTWDGNQSNANSNTFVTFSASVDGSPSLDVISFAAVGNNNSGPAVDVGCTGTGNGAVITSAFTKYCAQLPIVGGSLDLSFTIGGMNTDGDDVALDNIELFCGTPPSGTIVPSCTPVLPTGTIFFEDFGGLNTANPFNFPCVIDDSRDYFGIVCLDGGPCGNDDINADYTPGYSGVTGSFFGARDINGDPCMNDAPVTSTAAGIDVSTCGVGSTLYLCFDIAESDTPSREGTDTWDGNQSNPNSNSFVTFSGTIDGCAFDIVSFAAIANNNSGPAADTNCDGTGDGAPVTSAFTTFCAELPILGNTLDLSFTIGGLNTDGDDVAIDNISISCGTDASGLPMALTTSCPFDNPPVAVCSNATALLDATGNVTITGADVDGGSSDIEGAVTLTVSPNMFTCADIGNNTVTLTVTDSQGKTDDCTATVTVADQMPPMVTCNNPTVMLDMNGVGTLTVADVLNTATDNCGVVAGGQLTQSAFTCSDAGTTNTVTLTVTDVNGLSGSCQATVSIADAAAPMAVCMDITVQLDATGAVTIMGSDIDGGSSDACGALTFEAAPNAFTCGNVGANTVTLTVIDIGGNTDDCTATVTVEDNVNPMAVCQNTTVNLDADGEGSIVPADVDGGSSDACGITLSVSQMDFNCDNIGSNNVTLTATDPNGNETTCIATVTVVDPIPAIILCRPPVNTENDAATCGAVLTLLPPVVIEENCSITNVTSDAPNLFPAGTTVVTWTLTDAGGNNTECQQDVTVVDVEAPELLCGEPFFAYLAEEDLDLPGFPFDNSCQYPSYVLDQPEVITDNCGTGSLTITNDAPQFFPPGQYTVTYTATDFFGNVGTCEQSVEVYDITAPELTSCPDDIVVTATSTAGANVSWSLPTATDQCSTNEIFVSEANNANSGDLFPVGETAISYQVSDENGQFSLCEFTITVESNSPLVALAGMLATENIETIQNAEVYINGGMTSMQLTAEDGLFNFGVPVGGDYSVAPSKNDDLLNGVTTYDLVLITKHILGIQTLDSPYKMIAADINNSGQITTLDLVYLQKAILLIEEEFPNNTSWRFIDESFVFDNPTNPFEANLPEIINVNNMEVDLMNADFVGVKIGDVSGNAVTNGLLDADDRSGETTMTLTADNKRLSAGEVHTVELAVIDFQQVGFQFTLNFDAEKLDFQGIEPGLLTADNFGLTKLEEGAITVSWYDAAKMNDQATIGLTFIANTSVNVADALSLNSRFTPAEAYTTNGEIQDVQLNFGSSSSTFQLYQNMPNPFAQQTTLGFNLPTDSPVTILVNDVSGKVIYQTQLNGAKGYNQVELTRAAFPSNGVYYYSVATKDEIATGKMILMN